MGWSIPVWTKPVNCSCLTVVVQAACPNRLGETLLVSLTQRLRRGGASHVRGRKPTIECRQALWEMTSWVI